MLKAASARSDLPFMRERARRRMDRLDRAGGRIVARFWGTVLLAGAVVVAIPMLVGLVATGSWAGALVVTSLSIPPLALVRYLFSPSRRLSEIE